MAKDARLYGKFTLDFPDHPKIAILSDGAFRCLVEATLWSRKQERDGLLARRYAVARWSLDVLQELCSNDDENPSLIEREEGWYIHDYADHQDTKADIEARRERNRTAGQKGGLARAKQSAKRGARRPASETLSETQAEKEKEKVTTEAKASVGHTRGSRLPDGWQPSTDLVAQMRSEHPNVDLRSEHDKFTDYWRGIPGAKGRKADWPATWRNWIRRAAENTPRNNGTTNGHRVAASDAAFAAAQALKTKPSTRLEIE